MTHVTRTFGSTVAVDDVSLSVGHGELLALVGQNGAGKTTLMRIAAGELAPDRGEVRNASVALVHQHFMLVPALTVAENIALARPGRMRFTSRARLEREAEALIAATGIALERVRRPVSELSVGEQSKLELIKAIANDPDVLILDEPTSVLTPLETEELFEVMRRRAASGRSVVFISHKLPEVFAVARRIVVMLDGRIVADAETATTTPERIAAAMTQQPVRQAAPRPPLPRVPRAGAPLHHHGNLELRSGRIAAIVGVAGNGQTELASALRRDLPRRSAGLIPEDRTRDGVIAEMTIAENLALSARRWNPRAAEHHARQIIGLYSIRARGPLQLAGELSGGNQQKLLLARELDPRPTVIVAAEPTRGLDLASTRFVHQHLIAAAAAGAAIVVITSDLDEAFAIADTIHVIYRGSLSAPMTPQEASQRVAALMAGLP